MTRDDRFKAQWMAWRARARSAWSRWDARLRSFLTPPGRQRLRRGFYARFPYLIWGLALAYRNTLLRHVRLVVVVGSFGKTTTTRATAVALGRRDPGVRSGNYGTNLAANLLGIRPWHPHAVLEVAISDVGQMEVWARRLKPSVAVVTCVGSEHLSSLGSLEITRAEKAKMVEAVPADGQVILNGDDPNVLWMHSLSRAPVLTYGLDKSCDIQAVDVRDDTLSGNCFRVEIDGVDYSLHTKLVGRTMIYPFLAALGVANAEGIALQEAVPALESLPPTYNRLQPIPLGSGVHILLDARKGALETIEAALETIAHLPAQRRIVVIGDVEEPPGSQGPIYKALGTRLGEVADRVLFVGGRTNFRSLRAGMRVRGLDGASVTNLRNNPHAIREWVESNMQAGDLILIKGRSTQHLERVELLLTGQKVTCTARLCRRKHDCASCPVC